VVVQLKRGVALPPLLSRYNLTLLDQFGQRPIYRLRVAAGSSADTAVVALRLDAGVRYAERNLETDTPEGSTNDIWLVGGDAGTYTSQWAPQALSLEPARALSTGAGVRVAVLDTGVDATHPNLASQMARASNGSILGYDFVDDDTDASEAGSRADLGFGHGTHVAGLVALVAPGARVMPVRVLDRAGRGNIWVLADALRWAVDPDGNPNTDDGAHVINLSLGTQQETDLIQTLIELANCSFDDDDDDFQGPGFDDDRTRCANGFAATVVAAAGNAGSATQRQYPAAEAASGVLSVAASNAQFRIAPFSNFGSWIRVAAPGDGIISTVPGGGWGTWRGTSMASPLVAGTAALLIATPAPGTTPGRTALRQWQPSAVVDRIASRSKPLCAGSIKQVDTLSALTDAQVADPPCN
jgi:subtilisin family serine protease